MKNILYFFLLLSLLGVKTSAQQIKVNAFSINNSNLKDGALLVSDPIKSTSFKYQFTLARSLEGSGWYDGTCKVYIAYSRFNDFSTKSQYILLDSLSIDNSYFKNASNRDVGDTFYKTNIETSFDSKLPANLTGADFSSGKVTLILKFYDNVQKVNRTELNNIRYSIIAATPTSPPPSTSIDPAAISKIQSMGFNTSGILSDGEFYLVENEILIRKNTLFDNNNAFYVNNEHEHNIYVLIKQEVWAMGQWDSAIYTAVRQWNSSPNSDIKLHIIYQYGNEPSPPADIIIAYQMSNYAVKAEFPNGNGKAGRTINIGRHQDQLGNFNPTPAILRALGHSLGLKNNSEPSSVMNHNGANGYMVPLNSYDNQSISNIYPINPNSQVLPLISGLTKILPGESASYHESYIADVNYGWKVSGISGTSYDEDYNNINNSRLPEVSFPSGSYQVRCELSGGKFLNIVATKNIVVQ